MANEPRIDIEREFPVAVRQAGGEIVDELLPSKHPEFDNADYLFRTGRVIAELKRLERNTIVDPDFLAKLGKIYGKLMREGRAPVVFGRGRISLEQIARIDERAAYEFIEPYKQRLGRIVKKANRQIKETANHFKIADSRGLLILANEGDLSYELGLLDRLLFRLLQNENSCINMVLYFTENITVNVPGFHPAAGIWVPMTIPNRQPIDKGLIQCLFDGWINRVATLRGEPVLAKGMGERRKTETADVLLNNTMRPTIIIE